MPVCPCVPCAPCSQFVNASLPPFRPVNSGRRLPMWRAVLRTAGAEFIVGGLSTSMISLPSVSFGGGCRLHVYPPLSLPHVLFAGALQLASLRPTPGPMQPLSLPCTLRLHHLGCPDPAFPLYPSPMTTTLALAGLLAPLSFASPPWAAVDQVGCGG